jgi:hypothetical protein
MKKNKRHVRIATSYTKIKTWNLISTYPTIYLIIKTGKNVEEVLI